MRELSFEEIEEVSGGWRGYGHAATVGAAAGFMNSLGRGARFGAALGPYGAIGGALVGATAWGIGSLIWG